MSVNINCIISILVPIEKIAFVKTKNCPMLTWSTPQTSSSLCDVELFITFVQKDFSRRSVEVPVLNEAYQQCSLTLNAVSVIYKTIVYFWNGSQRVRTSYKEPQSFETSLRATTTTTITTKSTTLTTTPTTTASKTKSSAITRIKDHSDVKGML